MRHVLYKRPGAGIVVVVLLALIILPGYLRAQLLVQDDFTGYTPGSLAGQGNWVNRNQVNLILDVAAASPLVYPCYNGGGGNYVVPSAATIPYNQRLSYPTTNFTATTDQSFYVAFLLRIANAGSEPHAHILGLGNDFGGTDYEFLRIHVQSAGSGFTLGISEGNGVGLGGNSDGGIEWSSEVYNLNQTYVVVARYDYDNGAGPNADALRLWVNPPVGVQPQNASADVVIAAGSRSNDILFDGDNVRNLYLNYRGAGSPVYAIDAIRYARGTTPAAAWSALNAEGDSDPVVSTTATAVSTNEDTSVALSVTLSDTQTPVNSLVLTAASSNQALLPDAALVFQSTTGSTRVLTATPTANASGSAVITFTVVDECQNIATTTLTLTVVPVNDAPAFSTGASVVVTENSGAYSAPFAVGIDDGDPDAVQTLTFVVSNNNNALFSVQPSVSPGGVLTFTPAANATGTAVVNVSLTDNGGTANGGVNTSAVQTFRITVVPVAFIDDFTAYSPGTLAGQGGWFAKNPSNLVLSVANSAPLQYGGCYNGGGGNYVVPSAGGVPYNQRIAHATPNLVASADQVFYVSFLLRIASAGTDTNAHILGLGNDFGGVDYEFLRVHVRSAGGGYNIGVSEGPGTSLGGNSDGGIEWGAATYTLNQTYLVVARYVYDNGGGPNADDLRLWVNPDLSSEPSPGSAVVDISAGERGNDILFDGDNVRNLYLNYRGAGSPVYAIDAIRYARAAMSSLAWTALGAAGAGTPPTVSTTATAVSTPEDTPVVLTVAVGDAQTPLSDLVVTASSGTPAIVSTSGIVIATTTGATRTLTVTPAPDAVGVVQIAVTVADQCSNTATTTFTLTVVPVNDEPAFSTGASVVADALGGPFSTPFAVGIDDGDPEVAQTLTFVVSNNNNALFTVQPSISPAGVLSFTPSTTANGTATVSVYLTDNGGTAGGGDDTSPVQTFTIRVVPLNGFIEDFTNYAPGSLAGQDSWTGKNTVNLVINVDDDTPLVYPCFNGGGGNYVTPAAGNTPYNQRIQRTTPAFVANTDQVFYLGFLLNIASAGTDPDAHIIALGNDFGGTSFEFLRVHVRSAVGGYNIGLSEGGGTSLGDNSIGIEWGATTYTLNQTYLVLARYDFDHAGGADNDVARLWVNPPVNVEPSAATAEVEIAPGEFGNDILFDGDIVRNVYLNYRGSGSPLYKLDALRYTRAAVSSTAWANLELGGGGDAPPTVSTTATAVSTPEDTAVELSVAIADAATPVDDLVVTAFSGNTALVSTSGIVVVPAAGATRTIAVTPQPDAAGVVDITVTVADQCQNVASTTFTLTLVPVNDEPVFSTGANVVVGEDSGAYDAAFATGIDDGDPEVVQNLTFVVNNDNNALFSVQPSINAATGNLSFTPAANANGTAVVSVYLTDDGGTAGGGDDTSPVQSFTITVNAVNDEPVFSTGANVVVGEDSGAYDAAFATGIDDGDPEVVQNLTFVVNNDNNALFSVQPSINAATGNLSFTPAANANGTAVVSVYLTDDGGTAGGGDDTSPVQSFTITVNAVNDEPVLAENNGLTLAEGATATITSAALQVSDIDNTAAQLVYTVVVPPVNGAILVGGVPSAGFTQADIDAALVEYSHDGSETTADSFVFTVADGAGGVVDSTGFVITITPVNDNPVAVSDATSLCPGATAVVAVLANDSDAENDGVTISAVTQGAGGTVVVLPGDTAVSYTANAGFSGGDTFTYTIADGNGGSSTATVQVTVFPQVTAGAGADVNVCAGSSVVLSGSGASAAGGLVFTWTPATGLDDPTVATPTAQPAATTVYTLTVADANGCSSTASVTVTVLPLPVATVSPDTTICPDDAVQLMATGGVSYTWSPAAGLSNPSVANPVASPDTTTTYTVLVTDASGCQSTASVTITVGTALVAQAGPDTAICAGGSVQLFATGGVSYTWSPAAGLSNPNIANPVATPGATTTYVVTVVNAGGCVGQDTVVITVNPVVVNVKVFLEGPYQSGGSMSTALNQQGYLPLTSPYGTGETVSSIPATAVDWVLLEFRTTASGAAVVRKSAFLTSNGDIVGTTGAPLTLSGAEASAGGYYIVVRHRNHLDIMSSSVVPVSGCSMSWNFTTGQGQAYRINQDPMYRVQLSPARYAMRAADPDGDGISTVFDRVMIIWNFFDDGYEATDLTLNGEVRTSDLLVIQKHLFRISQVP